MMCMAVEFLDSQCLTLFSEVMPGPRGIMWAVGYYGERVSVMVTCGIWEKGAEPVGFDKRMYCWWVLV